MGNSKTGGDDDITAKGKYLLISVPDFGDDPITGGKMTSYLRLGAASTTWREDPGGDLAGDAYLSGPIGGRLSPDGVEVDLTGDVRTDAHQFMDDPRYRGAGGPHFMAQGERESQSAVLHTRGGWRDHSDGNRITTTYGDKIEVIRGNYKMVVLGRQDDIESAAGWDVSGGIVHDFAYMMPGAGIRTEWSQRYDGVWNLQSSLEGMISSTNQSGDFYEFAWGEHLESTTGSENPMPVGPNGCPRQNPHIIEKTWATQIESYTGSAAWPIPVMIEQTWALTTTSLTNVAASISETTICPGAVTSVTTVGNVTETTTAGTVSETTTITTSMSSNTTAPVISEITTVGASNSLTTVGAQTEMTTAGAITGLTTAGAITDLTAAGVITEISACGAHIDINGAALLLELFIGGKISIDIAAAIEIFVGAKLELSLVKSATYSNFKEEVSLTKSEHTSLEVAIQAVQVLMN